MHSLCCDHFVLLNDENIFVIVASEPADHTSSTHTSNSCGVVSWEHGCVAIGESVQQKNKYLERRGTMELSCWRKWQAQTRYDVHFTNMINDGDEVKHVRVGEDTLLKERGVKSLRWSSNHPLVLQQRIGESRKCHHE